MNNETIGFVILNYRTWEKTISCIESIYKTYFKSKEIVVVDNQSPNDSYVRLKANYETTAHKEITIVQTDRNGGFSYGNNFGFDYITKHFPNITKIVITNNDILFKESSIERLIGAFADFENVVMTAPSVYDVNGKWTNAPWKKKPTVIQEIGLRSFAGYAYKKKELKENRPVYMVCGCCFAVDCSKFISSGRFDENVFLYNEENIFSMNFAKRELQIIYCPNAKVIHDHGTTTGNGNVFVDKEYVKSTLYFLKYYENLSNLKIILIKWFYIVRIIAKKAFGRYNDSRLIFKGIMEIIKYKV